MLLDGFHVKSVFTVLVIVGHLSYKFIVNYKSHKHQHLFNIIVNEKLPFNSFHRYSDNFYSQWTIIKVYKVVTNLRLLLSKVWTRGDDCQGCQNWAFFNNLGVSTFHLRIDLGFCSYRIITRSSLLLVVKVEQNVMDIPLSTGVNTMEEIELKIFYISLKDLTMCYFNLDSTIILLRSKLKEITGKEV